MNHLSQLLKTFEDNIQQEQAQLSMDWEGKSTGPPPDLMGQSMGKSHLMGKSWKIYGTLW